MQQLLQPLGGLRAQCLLAVVIGGTYRASTPVEGCVQSETEQLAACKTLHSKGFLAFCYAPNYATVTASDR